MLVHCHPGDIMTSTLLSFNKDDQYFSPHAHGSWKGILGHDAKGAEIQIDQV